MEKLWHAIHNNVRKRNHAFQTFLFIHTFLWTVPPFLIVLAGCLLLHVKTIQLLSVTLTVTGISGVFIGFFGGLLFLLSTTDEPSQELCNDNLPEREYPTAATQTTAATQI